MSTSLLLPKNGEEESYILLAGHVVGVDFICRVERRSVVEQRYHWI